MRILICEPGRHPRVEDIPHNLSRMQEIVDGTIQAVYPWHERAALICNDEGLIREYPFNRIVGPYTIFGTFFICGIDDCDFSDLSDELVDRLSKQLYAPQILMDIPGGYVAVPVEADE